MVLKQPDPIKQEEPTVENVFPDRVAPQNAEKAPEQYWVQPFPEGQPATPCPELALECLAPTESRGVFTVGMS